MRSVPRLDLRPATWATVAVLAIGLSRDAGAQLKTAVSRVPRSADPGAELQDFSIVDFVTPESVDEPIVLDVPIDGEIWTLEIEKHSVRSAIFEVRADVGQALYEAVDPGRVRTFRGIVREHKEAVVAGSLLETGLEAIIILPDGTGYGIQPLRATIPGALARYVVYRKADVIPTEARCDVDEVHPRGEESSDSQGIGSGACGSDFCVAQLACDTDVEFFTNHGSSTGQSQSRIEALVNIVNVEYERDVNITHVITTVIVRTAEPDPYSQTSTGGMLGEMQAFWNANLGGVTRDVAHLFSGKNTGGVIGTAFIGVVCDLSNAYGVSAVDYSNLTYCDSDLIAHEIGHNWNANHCACSNPDFTMNSFITCALRFDAATSIGEITAYRNSVGCLDGGGESSQNACRDAVPICNGSYVGSTSFATTDGSASCGSSNTTPDVWFTYVPAANGTLTLHTCGSSYDTVLSVHSACPGNATNEVACNDDAPVGPCSGTLQSQVSFAVTAGTRYFVRVSGFNGSTGTFLLSVSGPSCTPPPSDACANAIDICSGTYYGSTTAASTDGSATCGSSTSPDVWYRYTPSQSGVLGLDLCDSTYDTTVSLHTGCPGTTANEVACNDDGCGGSLSSNLTTIVVAGQTYLIRVSGFSTGNVGPFKLGVTGPDCQHDFCNGAIAIGNGRFFGNLVGAGNDGSASCGSSANAPDVWYRYTSPCTGTMTANTCGTHDSSGVDTGMDTVVSLHSGCPGTTGNEIACIDDALCVGDAGASRDSIVSASLTTGQQVLIRVSRFSSGKVGPYILTVGSTPSNDACASATVIGNGTFSCTLEGASNDGSASCGSSSSSADVYFSYTATCNGVLRVNTCGTHDAPGQDLGMDSVVSIHSACPATPGNEIACNDDWSAFGDPIGCIGSDAGSARDSAVVVPVSAGQSFLIRVAQFAGSASSGREFRLNVSCNRAPNTPGAPSHDGHAIETVLEPVTAVTNDPDGDRVTYTFDWGDGTMDTSAPTASGTPVTLSHAWTVMGVYDVRVRATDAFGNASPFSAARSIDVAGIACRTGNVDVDNGGPPVDVLSVNGSAGAGPGRVTSASRSAQITVSLVRPPVSSSEARYAVWVWPTQPTSTSEVSLPFGVGVICKNPMLSSCGSACPLIGAKTIVGFCGAVLCSTAEATGATPPGVILRIPVNRFAAGTVLWAQGVIRDNSDSGPKKVSVTNGIEVHITP